MQKIDDLLNKITMYRLVVYVLSFYCVLAVLLAYTGQLSMRPGTMLMSLVAILLPAYVVDRGFGRLFNVPTNKETWLITGLILFLLIRPAHTADTLLVLGVAGAVSSASKFLIARMGKHVFNPAAFAAAFLSLWGFWPVTWWIGSSLFWPFTLLLGLAIVRKMRRLPLFITFVGVSIIVQAIMLLHGHHAFAIGMKQALVASPLIFLSTIMLTEPATMPPRRNLQIIFAALVAVLYTTGWQVGRFIIYPEVALLLGNIFAYVVSPKFRLRLELIEIQRVSDWVYHYVFKPEFSFAHLPGQYMEWTLDRVPFDGRGNRRTFTLASSPTEETVQVGLKYYEPASTYKATFHDLQPGDIVYASQLAGNFTLAGNEAKKLAFVAGGIGITPFRSMIKYLTDTHASSDIVLLYLVSSPEELAYIDTFKAATTIGVRTLPIVTDPAVHTPGATTAQLSPELIRQAIPDYQERIFYISGPNKMVDASKSMLRGMDIARTHIKTDHFSGY